MYSVYWHLLYTQVRSGVWYREILFFILILYFFVFALSTELNLHFKPRKDRRSRFSYIVRSGVWYCPFNFLFLVFWIWALSFVFRKHVTRLRIISVYIQKMRIVSAYIRKMLIFNKARYSSKWSLVIILVVSLWGLDRHQNAIDLFSVLVLTTITEFIAV